jgi:hypothetical protein
MIPLALRSLIPQSCPCPAPGRRPRALRPPPFVLKGSQVCCSVLSPQSSVLPLPSAGPQAPRPPCSALCSKGFSGLLLSPQSSVLSPAPAQRRAAGPQSSDLIPQSSVLSPQSWLLSPQSCSDAVPGYMPRAIRTEQAIKVHKCDGHGKVDFTILKSMFRREMLTFCHE